MEAYYTDVAGAAAYLNTTPRHIRGLVQRREIPFARLGRLLRFDTRELDAWIPRVPPGGDAA